MMERGMMGNHHVPCEVGEKGTYNCLRVMLRLSLTYHNLTRADTDLFVMAKYQKMSIGDLSTKEFDEFVAGIKSTPAEKLRDFVDRYKASLELKNTAVA
jgi:hypothetical protein